MVMQTLEDQAGRNTIPGLKAISSKRFDGIPVVNVR
jgi:hypothetical protein